MSDPAALPPLPPAHARALEDACQSAVSDPECRGLLLCGSCARGDALPGSDLDLRLFLRDDAPARPFAARTAGGVFIETTCGTLTAATERLQTRPMEVYPYREGRILYDPEGVVATLQQQATTLYDAYRASEEAKAGMAYWMESAQRKLTAARDAGAGERGAFVAATTTWPLLEALFLAADRPLPPSGAVRAHLPDACERIGGTLTPAQILLLWNAATAETRVSAALEILQVLLPRLTNG